MDYQHPISSIARMLEAQSPNPFFVFRPHALARAVKYFQSYFQGNILYALKTNPEPHIIKGLCQLGIDKFDVASLQEISLIKKYYPEGKLFFMHPVKSRHAIREAYFHYGVRHFSLDTQDELEKILEETDQAKDLQLHLRIAIPNAYAEHNLAEKFGIKLQKAPALLKRVRKAAYKLGVCFHVGSQCMHPDAYRIAMRMTGEVFSKAQVPVEYFNIGGGFPSIYPGMIPPPLSEYFDTIHEEFSKINSQQNLQLLSEPGRALIAETTSLVVRVELRKGDILYINDGTYGSLFDAGVLRFIYPVRLIRSHETDSANLLPFSFYGPTCDSLDYMKGPFYLPQDVREGDLIEIGQLGAYGRTLATGFNGFVHEEGVIMINDEPLMTMYEDAYISKEPFEVIAA